MLNRRNLLTSLVAAPLGLKVAEPTVVMCGPRKGISGTAAVVPEMTLYPTGEVK